tara:strand:- start:3748 stop:5355 length:1608 start_codon:yes stop_codon:yes gene_type:complete
MAGFDKIIELDEYFRSGHTLEPTAQLLDFSGSGHQKLASEAAAWSSSIQPRDDSTYILVLAMGASEFYGPNRNGDAFRESELKKTYKTFETNAKVYKSHVNKDPEKSYGDVEKAFYNDDMHRVELILRIDNDKAPDIVEKINSGRPVAVSMGCRIKYDVCTICGNKAPSRASYCKHLKHQLNDIYPDGRIVAADNPNPNFFDISIVWRPADKTGYMLKKVASDREVGDSSALLAEKTSAMEAIAAYLNKAADIDKLVTGVGLKAPHGEPSPEDSSISSSQEYLASQWLKTIMPKISKKHREISPDDIKSMSSKPLAETLSTLSGMGVFLATPEFMDLVFNKVTGSPAPEGLAEKLVALQGDIFKLFSKYPEITSSVLESGVTPSGMEDTDSEVEEKVSEYLPYRSLKQEWVSAHLESNSTKTAAYKVDRPSACSPEMVKIAVQAYTAYVAHIQDLSENAGHSKLAALTAPDSDGYHRRPHMPWAPATFSAMNHDICGGGYKYANERSILKSLRDKHDRIPPQLAVSAVTQLLISR